MRQHTPIMILRRLASDPAWFLQILAEKKESLSPRAYVSAQMAGVAFFESERDSYLKNLITATYARFQDDPEATGTLPTVIEMIACYANAATMRNLFSETDEAFVVC